MDTTAFLKAAGSGFAEYLGIAIGLGFIVIGSSIGIGIIGGRALESIARQPDVKNDIRATMILAAAFIEGVAFFAAVICLIIVLTK